MLTFYGDAISQNRTKTPEGYLIALNCPLARTGWYEYLGTEIGLNTNEIVRVYRSPEEVFSKESMASFNGKSITDEHPPELVVSDNNDRYEKGTVINIKRGKGNESDLLLGDLIIKDPILIEEVENNIKKEVSCGYECNYKENEDGTYSQIEIRGNHVAVVEAGRAGNRVAIKDSKLKGDKNNMSKKAYKTKKKKSSFLQALGLKSFAVDAEPDEISDTLDELVEERGTGEDEETTKEVSNDEEVNSEISALSQQVAKLTEIVSKLVQTDKSPEQELDEAIESLSNDEDLTDEENSVTVPVEEISQDEDIPDGVVTSPEDRPKNPISGMDSNKAMAMALKAIKPVIANISNPTEKRKACDSLLNVFKSTKASTKSKNGYAEILKTQRKNTLDKQKAMDEKQKSDEQIGEKLKKKFNPHYKEVE
ncbi:hypothetical protein DP145_01715 [Clostridium tetani]|uniref:DUF2213 domain-containing protein n=1 Tax=Clostridium tetani TaxID=1513 RepID=UPI00100BDC31|nr:DUF2213 domain-containing protein [Clostridium tetani]RXI46081.1 hypothetical protein DP126_07795 [Clostridium tetani]RXM61473.1 hypothetical protein DP138_04630 [Clostridium tetani]RXM70298.1 hypothetical protein DP145_01715 [Clostridium tetani]